MSIFSKVTLQSLYRNRTRTIVTIIVIILSVALVTAVATFVSSLQNYGVKNSIAFGGDWHIAYHNADEAFYDELRASDEVEHVALIQEIAYAEFYGETSPDDAFPVTAIMGFEKELYTDQNVRDKVMGSTAPYWNYAPLWSIADGRWPQNDTELVVPEGFIYANGVEYHVGDTIVLNVSNSWTDFFDPGELSENISQDDFEVTDDGYVDGDEIEAESIGEDEPVRGIRSYTIVGTYAFQSEGYDYMPATVYTVADPAELNGNMLGYSILQVTLKNPADVYNFESRLSELPTVYNTDQLRWLGQSDNDNSNTVLYSLAAILIGLIVFGLVLAIYNAFSISISERKRQFGILSSVGATKKQLRNSVLFEALCIALIGIPLGLLLGFAGTAITLDYASGLLRAVTYSDEVPLSLSVSGGVLLASIAIGILTILISAYIPARRASQTSAVDNIRQTDDIKLSGNKLKNSKLIERFFGLEGSLAHKNSKRNKKRYRPTILSLFISIVLFISAGALGMFLSSGISRAIDDSADLLVSSYDQVSKDDMPELYEQLRDVEGVTKAGYRSSLQPVISISNELLTEQFLTAHSDVVGEDTTDFVLIFTFLDDKSYLDYLKDLGLSGAKYTAQDAPLVGLANERFYDPSSGRYVVRDIFKNKNDISLPVSFQLDSEGMEGIETKELMITLVDEPPWMISRNTTAYPAVVFAPYSLRAELDPSHNVAASFNYDESDFVFLSNNPQATESAMQEILDERNGTSESGYYIYNVALEQTGNRAMLAIVNVFIYGFTIMIALIAVANVFNTVSTSINLRRRELAMLRSVGMTNASVNKMMSFECVLYGLKALLYGILVGILVSILIYVSVMSGVDVPFTLPWLSIGLSIVGVFVVVFISMMYAVHTVNKENTIEALRFDG
ncbi:MAG: ABC transporter permease [Coriobacteriales bacterium]|jgi:putative ABC transport system permease protein|nr:ABC transporter permease [Coriobacteriales bacterium]